MQYYTHDGDSLASSSNSRCLMALIIAIGTNTNDHSLLCYNTPAQDIQLKSLIVHGSSLSPGDPGPLAVLGEAIAWAAALALALRRAMEPRMFDTSVTGREGLGGAMDGRGTTGASASSSAMLDTPSLTAEATDCDNNIRDDSYM